MSCVLVCVSCEILKKARARGLEIGNSLEHSGISGSSKLDMANKECQEDNLAEHHDAGQAKGDAQMYLIRSFFDSDINDTSFDTELT
jgi:hypothetical protein